MLNLVRGRAIVFVEHVHVVDKKMLHERLWYCTRSGMRGLQRLLLQLKPRWRQQLLKTARANAVLPLGFRGKGRFGSFQRRVKAQEI